MGTTPAPLRLLSRYKVVRGVGTKSALVPFEVIELVRRPGLVRGALLLLNLAIVVFLVRHARSRGGPRAPRP